MEETTQRKNEDLILEIFIPLEAKNPNNAYFRSANTGKGFKGMFMKPAYKNYKEQIKEIAKTEVLKKYGNDYIPYEGFIEIVSAWTFGTLRKKDLQNCGKIEYDAMNDVVYKDDSQIVEMHTIKLYEKNDPSVRIQIWKSLDSEYEKCINRNQIKKKKTKKNK